VAEEGMAVHFRLGRHEKYEENRHSLSVVVRIPPIDALIESGYVRAVNTAP
jgi:hypothetical protein